MYEQFHIQIHSIYHDNFCHVLDSTVSTLGHYSAAINTEHTVTFHDATAVPVIILITVSISL